jgi:hypothetical protein
MDPGNGNKILFGDISKKKTLLFFHLLFIVEYG